LHMTRKIIIDTDPGVDDVLALALAFLQPSRDVEISLITPVFGNTSLYHTVRNTVTFLNILDQERSWRLKHRYRSPKDDIPIVAMGAEGPIDGSKIIDAKHFHGKDGIGEVHTTHPHYTPPNHQWELVLKDPPSHFIPSAEPAHTEILKLLRKEDIDTVSIVAIGPLTNVAKAAIEDPETFSRGMACLSGLTVVREVIVMGGTLAIPGNVLPFGGSESPC
jgi:inosine-uridine nucleoside N-ribohydrolase